MAQSTKSLDASTQALVVLGVLQVIALIVSLSITNKSANAARRSADTATEALHITERADVVIDRITADHIGGELIGDTKVLVWFANRGRTRATNVTFEGTLGIPGGELMPKEVAPPVVIASGDEVPFSFRGNLSSYIPGPALAGVNAGDLILRLTGRLQYNDVFTQPHTIDFEGAWNREQTAFGVSRYEND